jgi:hypothetical protein
MSTFSTISHRLQADLSHALNARVPRGHTQQLLAAALGYQTFAAYAASPDAALDFAGVTHVVFDDALLTARQATLGYGAPGLPSLIRDAIEAVRPQIRAHESMSDLGDHFLEDVETGIADSDGYSSALAETNAYGPGYWSTNFFATIDLSAATGLWALEFEGTVDLDHDPDRAYSGDQLEFYGNIEFQKLGRRLLGAHAFEPEDCQVAVADDWYDDGRADGEQQDGEGGDEGAAPL